LIAEKESIFGADNVIETVGQNKHALLTNWKQAIINEGFSLVKYQRLSSENHRVSHVFAFAATNAVQNGSASTAAPEASIMWIRQDFEVVPETQLASSTDDEFQEHVKRYVASIASRRPVGIVGGGIGGSALGNYGVFTTSFSALH
jgi:hypothetical protein